MVCHFKTIEQARFNKICGFNSDTKEGKLKKKTNKFNPILLNGRASEAQPLRKRL